MSNLDFEPKILIFSTEYISDPAIDLTGLSHKEYPPTTAIIRVPCSSMIRPDYILLAIKSGFDGVFIAADGEECPFRKDCTEVTSARVEEALKLLQKNGIKPQRIKMAAICSVCTDAFVRSIREFYELLKKLGPVKRGADSE